MQKWVYLLEHHATKQPVIVGVFTSLAKAKRLLKTLPKNLPYVVYRLPTNKLLTEGRKLKDVQGLLDHWHFGTNMVEEVMTDKTGRIARRKRKMLEWPQ